MTDTLSVNPFSKKNIKNDKNPVYITKMLVLFIKILNFFTIILNTAPLTPGLKQS